MRLFKTLVLLMLLAALVPTAIVGMRDVSDIRELLTRDAQELAQERVKQVALKAQQLLDEPSRAAISLARVPGFFTLPLSEQRGHIAAVLNQQRAVTAITVFDANGERIPGLQAFAVKDIPPTEVASHEARARKLIRRDLASIAYSDVYVSPSRGEPVVTLAYPIGDPLKGFAAAELSLSGLNDMLSQEKVGSTGFAYVVDAHGMLVAAAPGLGQAAGADVSTRPAVRHLLKTMAASPDSEVFRVGNFGQGSQQVVGAYTVMPDARWGIVSEQPIALAYKQVGVTVRRILLGVLLAIGVASLLAWSFSKSVTRPVKNLSEGALEIARGKFGLQVKVETKNELGELARTFNYMSSQLDAYGQETTRLYESLEQGYLETIVALANSIDSKDAYTRGHSQRVGDVAVEIGREMGLTARELKQLQYGGILHDIGKIGIVESILCKQSRLTDEEMTVMKEHPVIGASIIEPVSFLSPVRAAVRSHHENWDGTGYPDKLKGPDIPLVARIVACADTFDACTSTRPYQKAMPLEKAMEILNNLRGARLDPDVVDALRRVLEKKGLRVEGHRQPVKLAS